jgi:hypothetical protein
MFLSFGVPLMMKHIAPNLLDGLVAYWGMQSDTKDDYGEHDGTDVGSISFGSGSGKVNNGMSITGTNSMVTLSDLTGIVGATKFSVAGWIYPTATGQRYPISVDFVDYPYNYAGWTVYQNNDSTIGLAIGKNRNQNSWVAGIDFKGITSTTIMSLNTWYHFVGTYDGNNIRFYVNGSLEATVPWVNGLGWATTNYGRIGAERVNVYGVTYDPYNAFGQNPFQGYLDEIGIWNRALNTAEVAALYNGGNGRHYASFYGTPAFFGSYSTLGTYDDTVPTYTGTWSTLTGQPFIYNGTLHRSQTTGDWCQFGVDTTGGTGNIRLISKIQPDAGSMDIYVDGAFILRHDQWGATNTTWVDQYDLNIGTFSVGQHVVSVRVNGRVNPYSQTPWVTIDGFKVQ